MEQLQSLVHKNINEQLGDGDSNDEEAFGNNLEKMMLKRKQSIRRASLAVGDTNARTRRASLLGFKVPDSIVEGGIADEDDLELLEAIEAKAIKKAKTMAAQTEKMKRKDSMSGSKKTKGI